MRNSIASAIEKTKKLNNKLILSLGGDGVRQEDEDKTESVSV